MKKIKVLIRNNIGITFGISTSLLPPIPTIGTHVFDCYEQFYIENPDLRYWSLDEATAKYKSWLIQKVLNEL